MFIVYLKITFDNESPKYYYGKYRDTLNWLLHKTYNISYPFDIDMKTIMHENVKPSEYIVIK